MGAAWRRALHTFAIYSHLMQDSEELVAFDQKQYNSDLPRASAVGGSHVEQEGSPCWSQEYWQLSDFSKGLWWTQPLNQPTKSWLPDGVGGLYLGQEWGHIILVWFLESNSEQRTWALELKRIESEFSEPLSSQLHNGTKMTSFKEV